MADLENRLAPIIGERNERKINYCVVYACPISSCCIFFLVLLEGIRFPIYSMPDYRIVNFVIYIISFLASLLLVITSFIDCYREIRKNGKVVPLETELPALPMVQFVIFFSFIIRLGSLPHCNFFFCQVTSGGGVEFELQTLLGVTEGVCTIGLSLDLVSL